MSEKPLSGMEKAAVLLKSLPPEVVEKVLQRMDARQAAMLRAQLVKINERADLKEIMAAVLDEAANVISVARDQAQGSSHPGSRAATPPLDRVNAPRTDGGTPARPTTKDGTAAAHVDIRLTALDPEADPHSDPLVAIAKIPPDLLAQALENESTRTISLLMNYLDVEIAGQIYKRLTPAKRKEVSMRFTEQTTIDEGLLRRIAQAVLQKCNAQRATTVTGATEPGAREKRMASLLRGLERTERMEMLGVVEQSDADLAGRIKSMLYQFEDVLRMQSISVQKLLTQIDTKSLAQALGGAAPELREKLFNNLSKRAQESLKEEIDLAGTVPSAKVRQAQQVIVDAIQGLDQRSELMLIE